MLQAVIVDQFKAFAGRHKLPLAPLTFLVGANAAGKSTVLQALLVLRQSWTEADDLPLVLRTEGKRLTRLGTPLNVIHGQTCPGEVRIGLDYGGGALVFVYSVTGESSTGARLTAIEGARGGLSVLFSVDRRDGSGAVHVQALRADERVGGVDQCLYQAPPKPDPVESVPGGPDFEEQLSAEHDASSQGVEGTVSPQTKGITKAESHHEGLSPEEQWETEHDWPFVLAEGTWRREGKAAPAPFQHRAEALLIEGLRDARRALDAVAYVGPLRTHGQRLYQIEQGRVRTGLGGEDFVSVLAGDLEVLATVRGFCREDMGFPYELDIAPIAGATSSVAELRLTDTRKQVTVGLPDVGFGVSQILPILTELAIAEKQAKLLAPYGRMLLVEQPELHLHPSAQRRLGRLLAKWAIPEPDLDPRGRQRNQAIIETHSELLVNAVIEAVASKDLQPEDVCFLAVERDDEGQMAWRRIGLRGDGRFDGPWPRGFLDPEG